MLQEGGLYPGLRPLEALRLFASYYDDPDDPERLLDLVGLRDAEHTLVRRMSGGQQQRLSLALALVGRPSAGVPRRADRGHGPARPRHDVDARSGSCATAAPRSCSPRTRWTRPSSSATASRSSTTGASSRADPRRSSRRRGGADIALLRRDRARRRDARARARARRRRRGRARRGPGDYVVDAPGDARRSSPTLAAWLRDTSTCCSASCAPGRRSLEDVFLRLTGDGARREGAPRSPRQTRVELHAHAAARREPARHARDPARHPRVLHQGRRGRTPTLQGSGRLPRARRARAGGDVERDGEPRHRDRIRAALRRAQATRLDAALRARAAHAPRRSTCSRSRWCRRSRSSSTGIALGWDVVAGGLLAAVGLLLLGTVAFAGIGMLLAGTLRAEANLALANGLFLVLLFLGGMAYPLAQAARRARGVRQGAARRPRSPRRVRGVLGRGVRVPDRRARRAARVGDRRAARRGPLVPLGGVTRSRRQRRRGSSRARASSSALGRAAPEQRVDAIVPSRSMKNVCGIGAHAVAVRDRVAVDVDQRSARSRCCSSANGRASPTQIVGADADDPRTSIAGARRAIDGTAGTPCGTACTTTPRS